ncbi:hypothetical protein [uncultured Maribacter sp.]|uniref:hypothetical protein n=1 Tax=uncultured Maribacter sp. TaxID=431308 RepID=UPI0030D9E69E|tara:strand:+ start:12415 stop:12684 length:270 start_codon:yes stop_codon:yes gene_type:complete
MILETINPGVHKVRLKVREIIYGNDVIDKYTGWDKVNPTLIKIRCEDCTLMVFGEEDMKLFKGFSSGDTFEALVHDGPYENVFKFKYFL